MNGSRIVSVIVPCRNEHAHLAAFAASALAQRLPAGWQLEVIVADGASDDGTREVLARVAAGDTALRVVDNPERIVSTGLNRALAAARGEVVVRMDVHTRYAPDYVAECIAALARTGADNVGGPWRAEVDPGGGATQEAVVAAFQSPLVAGGALSRRLDHEGPVDTVYLGAWPRATFERFGNFDEALVRNQDDEHNLRIVRPAAGASGSRRASAALPAAATPGPGLSPIPAVRLLEAVRHEEARPAGGAAPRRSGAVRDRARARRWLGGGWRGGVAAGAACRELRARRSRR